MKFRSNNCVSVHVPDLRKAEAFYSGVLGFRLLLKSPEQLEYDTGKFILCVMKGTEVRLPIPSFTVINVDKAKAHLEENGCQVVEDRGRSAYFRDPFGMIYNVVED
jgi:catechol 2,3-dioxygenase-like lactoylglutathione lyase family enzyme